MPSQTPVYNSVLRRLITPKRCLVVALAFFALMVVIGAIPGNAKAASAMVNDKILHFVAYACISSLIYGGLVGSLANRALRTLLAIALLGGLDETIQCYMSYRSANWADWGFDMLAALSCVMVLTLLQIQRKAMANRWINNTP